MIGRRSGQTRADDHDFYVGELVRQAGLRGVGMIESIVGDCAWVSWDGDKRNLLPMQCLRRIKPRGEWFDSPKRGGASER